MDRSPHSFQKCVVFFIYASSLCFFKYTFPVILGLTFLAIVTGYHEPPPDYVYVIVVGIWLAAMWKTNALKVMVFLLNQPHFIEEYIAASNCGDEERCRRLLKWMGDDWDL